MLPEAQPGLLSRAGYALIDDSETPVWNAQRSWIEPRQGPKAQDWYLFTYRDDYQHVLQEYARLCGPVPMIPRYVLGPMVTDLNFEYFPDSAASRLPQFRRYNQQYLAGRGHATAARATSRSTRWCSTSPGTTTAGTAATTGAR